MGNTADGPARAKGDSDVEAGVQRRPGIERLQLDANLQLPEEAFARIGISSPSTQAESNGEKKKRGIGSSIKRLLSGKSKRKPSPQLPRTVQDEAECERRMSHSRRESFSDKEADGQGTSFSNEKPPTMEEHTKKKTAWGKPHDRQTHYSEKSAETLQMAQYLGIDSKDETFLWIAAEALTAELPEGWEEHKTAEADVYFFNSITKDSSWEHPLDGYYRFLYRKMRKIGRGKSKGLFKSGKASSSSSASERANEQQQQQRAKDRELVDLLWVMEQDRRRAQVLQDGSSESSSLIGSGSSSNASSSHSRGSTGSSTSRDSSRSRQSAAALAAAAAASADPSSLPPEVRDMAAYLGIDLSALSAPITPEEVREMAEYLGIDVLREGYLLPLARMALLAPLPRGWEIYKDDAGEPFYYHRASRRTSYRHPADEYFIARVLEDRARHVRAVRDGSAARVSEPWVELADAAGGRYWHNFRTGDRAAEPPPSLVALDGDAGDAGDASDAGDADDEPSPAGPDRASGTAAAGAAAARGRGQMNLALPPGARKTAAGVAAAGVAAAAAAAAAGGGIVGKGGGGGEAKVRENPRLGTMGGDGWGGGGE